MKKTIVPGLNRSPRTGAMLPVKVTITYTDGRLSITGDDEANGSSGQIWGRRGQSAHVDECAPGWTPEKIAQLDAVWRDWHLNDVRAGSPAQRAHVAALGNVPYKVARDSLKVAGLSPDPSYIHNGKPYTYGSAWLSEPVPADVLAFLESL